MASRVDQERHIVAYGNYPMKPGGEPLFSCPTGKNRPGEKIFYNGVPGQLVAYTHDPSVSTIPMTLNAADLATVTSDLIIGVFVDQDGDGVADDVRPLAGGCLDKCKIEEASVGTPHCGTPLIEAASIDCVKCDETYTVKVTIENNQTRSWSPLFKGGCEFIASMSPDCCTCDDCPPEANCKEIVCELVRQLNGELDLRINGELYPDWKGQGQPRPFRAVRGHDNWFTYCISPDPGDCDCNTCTKIDAITEATICGETVTFNGNLDPSDPSKTLIPQLQNIAFQIECAFDQYGGDQSGFAVVTQGITPCCPLQLHVVTCDPDFAIAGLEPCAAPCELKFPCKRRCSDCSKEPVEPYVPECWIAIIAEPEKPDCKCYLEDVPWAWYGVKGKIEFMTDAGECVPNTKSQTLLEPKSPRNFGAQIQWLEYKFGFPGGRGRKYRASNYRKGTFGFPDDTSRLKNAVTAKCEALYCSYFLKHSNEYKPCLTSGYACTEYSSGIHVNCDDDVTLASWEEFFNALITANNNNCKVIGEVNCFPEKVEKLDVVKGGLEPCPEKEEAAVKAQAPKPAKADKPTKAKAKKDSK